MVAGALALADYSYLHATASLKTETAEKVLLGFTAEADFNALRNLANERLAETEFIALFSDNKDGSFNYLIASEKGDTREIVKSLNAAFSGKGGGKPNCAQGKITANTTTEITEFIKSNI